MISSKKSIYFGTLSVTTWNSECDNMELDFYTGRGFPPFSFLNLIKTPRLKLKPNTKTKTTDRFAWSLRSFKFEVLKKIFKSVFKKKNKGDGKIERQRLLRLFLFPTKSEGCSFVCGAAKAKGTIFRRKNCVVSTQSIDRCVIPC
jgi:hypothetical protein